LEKNCRNDWREYANLLLSDGNFVLSARSYLWSGNKAPVRRKDLEILGVVTVLRVGVFVALHSSGRTSGLITIYVWAGAAESSAVATRTAIGVSAAPNSVALVPIFLRRNTLLGILLKFDRTKLRGSAKRTVSKPLKPIMVSLDGFKTQLAIELGDGDLSLGIRRAVIFASMRPFQTFSPGN
jgi:hypothetical protein